MKRISLLVIFLSFILITEANDRKIKGPFLKSLERQYQKISRKVMPHVVQITSEFEEEAAKKKPSSFSSVEGKYQQYFLPKGKKSTLGLGSGFMVHPKGTVVTNYHVLEGANRYYVRLSNKKNILAKLISFDKKLDIAILKIPDADWNPIAWGKSQKVKQGSIVLAFGSPFGLQSSVTKGIVSAVERKGEEKENPLFIQTDAAINTGNSGGPLVNLEGRVVGMNTWIMSPAGVNAGVGFALPSNLIKECVHNLLLKKSKKIPWLGILMNQTADFKGVCVLGVLPNSPAEKAGIKTGDIITEVNGRKIDSPVLLRTILEGSVDTPRVKVKIKESPFRKGLIKSSKPLTLTGSLKPMKQYYAELKDTVKIKKLLEEIARGRDCLCDSSKELLLCSNCSVAKSELGFILNHLKKGVSKKEILNELSAPIRIIAWLDYSDKKSLGVYQELKKMELKYHCFIRVHYRHYPKTDEVSPVWNELVNAIEVLRIFGHKEKFIDALVKNKEGDWNTVFEKMFNKKTKEYANVKLSVKEKLFQLQIDKDLKDAESNVLLKNSPAVFINNDSSSNQIKIKDLPAEIKKLLLKHSL